MSLSGQDIEIIVRDGPETLDTRRCRKMLLPNGNAGALWRGLVYPLINENAIDIAGDAFSPGECHAGAAAPAIRVGFASIVGVDEVYLLLAGPASARESAVANLLAAGISVIRTGRYLGDPVDGLAADWFVRFEKPSSNEPTDILLARLLGRERVSHESVSETTTEARLRLVQEELARSKQREVKLRSELAKINNSIVGRSGAAADRASLEEEIINERRLRYEAEAAQATAEALLATAQAELETARAEPAPFGQTTPRARLLGEIADALETLVPNLNLLRDSVTVAAAEYAGRRSLYRALAELAATEGRLPPNWKAVQGAAGWWERHVSDGQDNTGRLYARWVPNRRGWDLLISDKAEQSRDMAWLRRASP